MPLTSPTDKCFFRSSSQSLSTQYRTGLPWYNVPLVELRIKRMAVPAKINSEQVHTSHLRLTSAAKRDFDGGWESRIILNRTSTAAPPSRSALVVVVSAYRHSARPSRP